MKIILLGRMAASARDGLEAEFGAGGRIVAFPEAAVPADRLGEFDDADVIVGGPQTKTILQRAGRL